MKTIEILSRRSFSGGTIVIYLIIVILLWMGSGVFKPHKKTEALHQPGLNKNIYKLQSSVSQEKEHYLVANGLTIAKDRVQLLAQVDGAVVKVLARSGQLLRKGDPIVQIDEKDRRYKVESTESALKSAIIKKNTAESLFQQKLGSKLQLEDATAALEKARSDFELAKFALEQTVLRAPYDGYIDEITAREGDVLLPQMGSGMVGYFTDISKITIQARLSEGERELIKDSKIGKITLKKGQELSGKVTFVSKFFDKASKTFLAEMLVENKPPFIVTGEEAVVFFDLGPQKMHHVPQSALALNEEGHLVLKAVNTESIVVEYKAVVAQEDSEGFWLTGLPEKLSILVLGQEYIKTGHKINGADGGT